MSIYRLNVYAFYGITLVIMACSFYELYYFMKSENEQTERTIIFMSIVGSIVSLIGLFMAIILDRTDRNHQLIPTYTFTIDDLPKPQPMMMGLNTVDP